MSAVTAIPSAARAFASLTRNPYVWHMPMAKTPGLRNLAGDLREAGLGFRSHRFSRDQGLRS
jgi:hypothetical protein